MNHQALPVSVNSRMAKALVPDWYYNTRGYNTSAIKLCRDTSGDARTFGTKLVLVQG